MILKNKLPKFFFGYGLAFFPLLLLIGPLVAEVFLTLSLIFFLFFSIKEKRSLFYKNRFLIFFSLFYLSTLYSTLSNFYSFDMVVNGIFYFRIPLFAFSIWFILERFNFFNKKIIFLYVISLFVIIFDSLLQYYFGKNLFGNEILVGRVSSFFGEELILGGFLLRTLPIFLIYLIMNDALNDKKSVILYAILISFVCLIIYLSGERTSFALLILFLVTIFFSIKYLKKFIAIIILIFLVLSTVLQFKNTNPDNPASRMFKKTYNQVLGIGAKDISQDKKKFLDKMYIFSHQHHGHYVLSFKIFKDHILFGTGTKGFRYLCRNKIYILENNEGCSTHPHNTYIQILVSNGVLGFLFLILAFIYIIKEIFISRRKILSSNKFDKNEISKLIAISAIFINIWPLIPSGNFFNNWLSMFYFYPVGFYLYFKHNYEK
tara:strand:+ start:953 stop:2248 length:1296 start_codon:yes stop_codon:yes gene_type:complete